MSESRRKNTPNFASRNSDGADVPEITVSVARLSPQRDFFGRLRDKIPPRPIGLTHLSRELRRSLVPAQLRADWPVTGPVLGSLAGHALLIALLMLKPHERQNGSENGQNAQPTAEVVFEPPSRHEMTGEPSPQQGGGSPQKAEPEKTDNASAQALPAPEGETAEIKAGQESKKEQKKTPHKDTKKRNDKTSPDAKDNPFAHPMDLSFPSDHPSTKRGRRGGNRRAVDLSTGPLSTNGQINAPYESKSTVKGVSSEYGAEIDQWIREHLFYPEDAIRDGEEGPSSVHVQLDRQGRVRRVILERQSGSYSLDAATVGMFQNQVLPPVPPDMKGDHFDIDVTVNYILLRG